MFHRSSARHYMTYQRGTIDSYELWATEVEDSTYNFSSFLPYFKRSVHFTPPNNVLRARNASLDYEPRAFSPDAGPLQVSVPILANPFSSFIKFGFDQLGLRTAKDFVSGSLFGVQYNMNTIDPKGQTRSSSETSFLRSAMGQTSLQVYKNTLAKKILFDGKRASAVSVNSGGVGYMLSAKKEVIVSAGAVREDTFWPNIIDR